MAQTKFIAHGFLGYEVVIDGSVQTNVLFALADEKQTLLAWYGFRASPPRGKENIFDMHLIGAGSKKPEVDCDFASVDSAGLLNSYPGQFSVAGLVHRPGSKGVSPSVQADLDMRDLETGMTACVLSVPSVHPAGLVMAFNLRPVRKRRTFDLKKPGSVQLISIQQFSRIALVNGPSPAILSSSTFRGTGSKQVCP